MTTAEKEFMITHVFKDIASKKDGVHHFSPTEEHFGVPWKISVHYKEAHLGFYLYCEQDKKKKEWSLEVWKEQKIKAVNGKTHSMNSEVIFKSAGESAWGWSEFIIWEDMMKDYVFIDTLSVEVHVKIKKMTGINFRNFDESKKELSDVVLVVENQKFYVSKLTLASQSTYFKTILLETHSTAPTLIINNTTSEHFQKFLEVLYGDAFIDETNVEGILLLSDRYNAQNPKRLCEEFLKEKSTKSLKEKWDLSTKYGLLSLKSHCLASMKTPADVASVLPSDLNQMDRSLLETLLQKSTSFK